MSPPKWPQPTTTLPMLPRPKTTLPIPHQTLTLLSTLHQTLPSTTTLWMKLNKHVSISKKESVNMVINAGKNSYLNSQQTVYYVTPIVWPWVNLISIWKTHMTLTCSSPVTSAHSNVIMRVVLPIISKSTDGPLSNILLPTIPLPTTLAHLYPGPNYHPRE